MRGVRALSSVVLASTLLGGCSSLPLRSERDSTPPERTAPRESELETRVLELRRQAAMAEAEIRMLRRQLAALTVEVERLAAGERETAARGTSPAPFSGRADEVEQRGSLPAIEQSDLDPVPATPPDYATPEAQVVDVGPDTPGQGTAAAREQDPESWVAVTPEDAAPASPPRASAPVSMAGQSVYDRGYTLYHQGRYEDAEKSFERFLAEHGNTDLADNAQFWIGESRFARQDYSGARLAFQEVLDRYPEGNKGADAVFKLGECLLRLGDPAAARRQFEEVLTRYPGSAASVMAEERLAELR